MFTQACLGCSALNSVVLSCGASYSKQVYAWRGCEFAAMEVESLQGVSCAQALQVCLFRSISACLELPKLAQFVYVLVRFNDVQAQLSVNGDEHRSRHWSSQLVVCCSWLPRCGCVSHKIRDCIYAGLCACHRSATGCRHNKLVTLSSDC